MDSFGNFEWTRTFRSNSKSYHQFSATSTSNGDIVIAGSTLSYSALGYKDDAFLIKADSKGNLIWTFPYGSSDEDDWGWSVFEKFNGNIVMIGSTKSFGASLFDVFLLSTNSEGRYN